MSTSAGFLAVLYHNAAGKANICSIIFKLFCRLSVRFRIALICLLFCKIPLKYRENYGIMAVIVIVLFQSGKSAGLSGAIGGVADSFLSRNKAKTLDAKLARATKWVGAIFLILTLVLLILQG